MCPCTYDCFFYYSIRLFFCIPLLSFLNLQEQIAIIKIIQDNTSKKQNVRETIAIGFQTANQ